MLVQGIPRPISSVLSHGSHIRISSWRRNPAFNPALLCHLSRLQYLSLEYMQLVNFDVPGTWRQLTTLNLAENSLTRIPGNLSSLVCLKTLAMQDQNADFQITVPMQFLTQLKELLHVHLWQFQPDPQDWTWNDSSLYLLMRARLLINNTPGCSVELED